MDKNKALEIAEKAWLDAKAAIDEEYGWSYDYGLSSCCVFEEHYDNEEDYYEAVYNDCLDVNTPDEDEEDEDDEEFDFDLDDDC